MKTLAQTQAGGALPPFPAAEAPRPGFGALPLHRLTPRSLNTSGCTIKTALLVLASILPLPALAELAADAAPSAVLVDAGPHERTWQTVRQVDTGHGLVAETNQYLEIQTGLNRSTANGWVETSPRIELFDGGAIATNLQYQVIFAPNLASRGSVDILLPDGNSRLTGQILLLAYVDGANSVWLAQVKDCAAELGGPDQNELTYHDAFAGVNGVACSIDVQYVLQRAQFSQNVILRSQLPAPADRIRLVAEHH